MACLGLELFSMGLRMHSTGFWVACLVCPPLPIDHSVVCSRSPVQLPFFAEGVPAGLMLPVIVTLAHHHPLLGPDDLRTYCEATFDETLGNNRREERAIGDSDEAGRMYRLRAGQRSEAKPDTVPT
jgi:hypothetical protein